jgi:Undecaprenyl-phosphate glucose phosphotransferase
MRAERLSWAEAPDSVNHAPSTAAGALERLAAIHAAGSVKTTARRGRFLHRDGMRLAARAIDAFIAAFVTLGLSLAGGIDLWRASTGEALPYLLAPVAAIAGVWLAGGYRFQYAGSTWGHLARTAAGGSAMMVALFVVVQMTGLAHAELFARVAFANALVLFALHTNYVSLARALTRSGALSDNVVIVGATQAAARMISRNAREREINILGYFDDRAGRAARMSTLMGDAPFLGGVDDLLAWDRLPEVDRIVVTVTSTAQERVRAMIDRLRTLPQEIILVLDLDGFNPEHTSLARVVDAPAAYVSGAPKDVRRAAVKRMFDVTVALAGGLVALPALALIALMIKLDSPGPVFFRQKRHGFHNEIIRVWKFRTMRPDKAAEEGLISQTVENDPRVTRIGRFLRSTSLDELPQLLNVLAGEMSIVGPRPHAVGMTAGETEVTRIVGEYAHRHRMKPGITGWAQINGSRGPVHTQDEVKERVRLDREYIQRASVWLDAYICVMTLPRLLGDKSRCR